MGTRHGHGTSTRNAPRRRSVEAPGRSSRPARRDLGLLAIGAERPVEARAPLVRAARVLVQLDASAARPAIAGLARLAAAAGDRDLAGRLAARALAPPVGAPPTAVEDEQRVTNLVAGIVPATAPLDDDAEMFDRCERLSL